MEGAVGGDRTDLHRHSSSWSGLCLAAGTSALLSRRSVRTSCSWRSGVVGMPGIAGGKVHAASLARRSRLSSART
jgi:hypothetical protein